LLLVSNKLWKSGINSKSKSVVVLTFMAFYETIWNATFQRFCLCVPPWIQNKHRIAKIMSFSSRLQPAARVRLAAHSGCIFFQHKRESQFINWDSKAVSTHFWQSSYMRCDHLLWATLQRVKNMLCIGWEFHQERH
jgi:hypothetical protein